MSDFTISTGSNAARFKKHLEIKNNNRILFSGIFGIGKTTFIRSFFEDNQDYFTINLKPVNYSVASNEDIFKLIKYDILYQLLLKSSLEIDIFEKFTKSEILSFWGTNIGIEYFTSFLKAIPDLGGLITQNPQIPLVVNPILTILNGIKKLTDNYKEFAEKVNTSEDFKAVSEFEKIMQGHYLFEQDLITQIIIKSNEAIAAKNKAQQTVLIIDDLDRIDPEHIFRLFNVFSTHFSDDESKNKFGFNKIVFVCDALNIKSIFRAKYGIKTDFNGYIDKFYSKTIFQFDNTENIISYLIHKNPYSEMFEITSEDIDFLSDILKGLLYYNLINLRNLLKLRDDNNIIAYKQNDITQSNISAFPFIHVAFILNYIVGNEKSLIDIISEAIELTSNHHDKRGIFTELKERDYFGNYLVVLVYGDEIKNERLQFNFEGTQSNNTINPQDPNKLPGVDYNFPPGTIWKFLLMAIKKISQRGFLN